MPIPGKQGAGEKFPELTPRQIAVLELLSSGCGKVEIATKLRIGERTVDRLINQVAQRLTIIDPRLDEKLGTVGRIARIVALYTQHYSQVNCNATTEASSFPLIRLAVRSELDITENSIQNDTQISVQCMAEEVTHTAHGIIIDDRSPLANAYPQKLEVWSHSSTVTVTHVLLVEDEKRPLFQIKFDPPLTKGQKLVYHFSQLTANYLPMTQLEITKRMQQGHYPLTEMLCEKSYSISVPTEHLSLRLIFPPSFEIADEQIIVEVGRGGGRDRQEEEKIQQLGAFRKNIFAKRTSLILDLQNPMLLRRYRLRWKPCT